MRTLVLAFILLLIGFTCHAEISVSNIIPCICEGQATQPFDVVATGSAGPFDFKWDGPEGYSSNAQSPDDIEKPGDYSLIVTDYYGCETIFSNYLSQCPGIQNLALNIEPNCASNGGNIITTVTGGTFQLNYEWSNGAEGVANLLNVAAGTYSVTVTDADGCEVTG